MRQLLTADKISIGLSERVFEYHSLALVRLSFSEIPPNSLPSTLLRWLSLCPLPHRCPPFELHTYLPILCTAR